MREVVIVDALRTPIGSQGGAFKNVGAVELATSVLKDVIKRNNLNAEDVDEVILGNVLSAGLGQNVSRQVALNAGLSEKTNATTINKVCGSGLKSVVFAAQSIMLGDNDVVIAGGTENMSRAPFVLNELRWGKRMGDAIAVDTMLRDGLTDAFDKNHMGITAENIAEKYGYTREQQDKLAVDSQNKAQKAIEEGRFKDEISPLSVPQRKGDPKLITEDEYPRFNVTSESLSKLKPAFKKDGTVTAGNASGINDGAAILLLMSPEKAKDLGLKPLVKIKSYGTGGVNPEIMGTGPIPATRNALEKVNLKIEDIDLIEANEAFAAQALSVIEELNLNEEIVNVNGGAIALGHPIGASGARILVTLIHEMKKRESNLGLATLCIGGGQGIALIVENLK